MDPAVPFAVVPPEAAVVRKVCVIGAGTMGGGIAAHLANLGFETSLLDVTRTGCEVAFSRTKAARPTHFYTDWAASAITLGGIEEDANLIATADWVIEAVVERLDAKHGLYRRIAPLLGAQTLLSSNTSGIEIEALASALDSGIAPKFVGTHFFNPPRYLKLLELIPHSGTAPEYVDLYRRLLEGRVARRVVTARDTPGFIANRYGMWAMFHAVHCAERMSLRIEDVDAMTGEFLGRPKSGSFRLNDLVGLDVMRDISANLRDRCRQDPQIGALRHPRSLDFLLEKGWIGEKAGQGYYRREGKELLALDLRTTAYLQRREPEVPRLAELMRLPLAERLTKAMGHRDELGDFLRMYLPATLQYAASVRAEIAHHTEDVDRVMKWGFGWSHGPFELADLLGPETTGVSTRFYEGTEQLATATTQKEPRRDEPEFRTWSDYEQKGQMETVTVRDLGDGVTGLGIGTKMGMITPTLVADLREALTTGDGPFVLHSEARAFSVGYDLKTFLAAVELGDLAAVERHLVDLQSLGALIESKRVVAAVHGYCLGAGLEIAASCGKIVASAESQIGLPESRVGLIPGGRGTALMRLHAQASNAAMIAMVLDLTKGTVAPNADAARQIGYIAAGDVTEYHPDRLTTTAIAQARTVQAPVRVWEPVTGPIVGQIDSALRSARGGGHITEYDEGIGERIKAIFAKTTGFEDAVARERKEFLELCHRAPSVARMRHMLDTGKPLRN